MNNYLLQAHSENNIKTEFTGKKFLFFYFVDFGSAGHKRYIEIILLIVPSRPTTPLFGATNLTGAISNLNPGVTKSNVFLVN